MSSRSSSLRSTLTLVLITVFLLSTMLTFVTGVVFTHQSLKSADRSEIRAKVSELAAQYERGGLPELRKTVERENAMGRGRPYYVRLADNGNTTLFSSVPKEWRDYGFERLEHRAFPEEREFLVLNSPSFDYSVEITSRTIGGNYLLQVGGSTKGRLHVIISMIRTFVLITLPATVLLLAFLWWFSKALMRPVTDLLQAASRVIDTGRYGKTLPSRGVAREFDELAELFNRMFATLEGLNTNLRTSLTTIAHEIRTPMTRLHMKAEYALREDSSDEDRLEALETCLRESENVTTLLRRILDTSEAESGLAEIQHEATDLAHLCREVAEMYGYLGLERDIGVEFEGPDSLELEVDPARIKQVLSNLLDNALKYSPAQSRITLLLEERGASVRLAVADEGPGIEENDLQHIWTYGFRSFGATHTRGHGLGLTLIKAIAEAHGGEVTVRNREKGGSEFSVYLPRVRS
jgi:hypothetical protein